MNKRYAFLLGLLAASSAQAQTPLLKEHFDYPAGDSLIRHGWYSHSGTAPNFNYIRVANGGLSWNSTPYLGSGVGNAASVSNTGSDENMPLLRRVDSGSVYASFLIKVNTVVTNTNRGYFFHLGEYTNIDTPNYNSISSFFRARVFKAPGSTSAKYKVGITFGSATVPSGADLSQDLDTGATYLLVVKYQMVPGATNDSVGLFVYADGDDISKEPARPHLGPYPAGTLSDLTTIQNIALRQYNSGQRIWVDGILVQERWNLLPTPKTELNAFNLLAPVNNADITVAPMQSVQANIRWNASLAGALPVTYEWLAVAAGGNFNTPVLTLSSNNSGSDTVLTLTHGALDATLASLGLKQGDSIALDWTVKAKADTMSRLASQVWRITLRRAVATAASLSAFNLLAPATMTSLTVAPMQSDLANISWTSSRAGSIPVTYQWLAVPQGGSFAAPALTLPSNNGGNDTVLTLTFGALDAALASVGVNQGDSLTLDWTVRAKADTAMRLASQVWRITLKRANTASNMSSQIRPVFDVLPNPAVNRLNIRLHSVAVDQDNCTIRLSDQLGRTLRSWSMDGTEASLDVSALPSGLYQIHVLSGVQQFSRKVLIQR